jgi:hypothetical protein
LILDQIVQECSNQLKKPMIFMIFVISLSLTLSDGTAGCLFLASLIDVVFELFRELCTRIRQPDFVFFHIFSLLHMQKN